MLKFWVVGRVGQILRGHNESGLVMAFKLLVGPRWREFHCLAAPPLAVLISYGL